MGKSTISGPFSIAMLNYQRVNPPFIRGNLQFSIATVDCRYFPLVVSLHLLSPRLLGRISFVSMVIFQKKSTKLLGTSNLIPQESQVWPKVEGDTYIYIYPYIYIIYIYDIYIIYKIYI